MKNIITLAVLFISLNLFAQVGINNTSPKATLDITAKTTGSKPEGLIVPQLTGDQIRAASTGTTPVYGSAQKGLILYASTADSSPSGATANITASGYYYFDGSAWQRIAAGGSTLNTSLSNGNIYVGNASNVATAVTPSGDVTISNTGVTAIGTGKVTSSQIADGTVANADLASGTGGIYKGDGSLSGNTTVTQGTNTLAFTSTASAGTSHFTVDGTTLNVDAVNNRVGIGVAAPKSFLQVSTLNGGASVDAGIFSINNCWLACSQSYTARNIVLNNLNSTNSVFASIDFVPSTDPTAPSGSSIQGIDRDGTNNYAGIGFWTRNASSGYGQRMVVKSAGNVGIGTSTPQATLDVNAISSGTSPEGIIAPRLSLSALQGYTYGTNQTGAMVYVNSVSGTPAGQTANVTAVGYYYFDGTNWQKVANGASVTDATTTAKGIVQLAGDLSGTAASPSIASSAVTSAKIADGTVANADLASGAGGIYKGDGSLSGNTTVTQGTNTLAFTSTASAGTSHFTVDGTTFNVNAVGNNVGIGTASPNSSAILDLTSSNKGLLIPKISLTSTTDATTIPSPASGLLIYNTNTSLIDGAGIYYNDGTSASPLWAKIAANSSTAFIPTLRLSTKGNSTTVTTSGGVYSTLSLSSTSFNDGNYNSSTSTYTVSSTGYYQVSAMINNSCNANGNNNGDLMILVNGSTYYSLATFNNITTQFFHGGTITLYFNTGDTIKLTSLGCDGCSATQYYWKNPSMTIMKVSN